MKLFNVARWCKTSLEDISTLMAGQLWPMLITDLGTGWSKNFLLGALAVIPLVLLKIPGRWIKFLDIPSILWSVSSSSTFAVSALFSAWRYVAVVFAVVMCPFVCLSYKPVLCLNDSTNQVGFQHGRFLPPIPHSVIRKFRYIEKLEYFSLELCPNSRLGKFRQVDRVVNKLFVDGRACWQHLYDSQWFVAVYYKSVNCNPLTPFNLLWICCTTCCCSWHDIDWHNVSCGLSSVAEFLVRSCRHCGIILCRAKALPSTERMRLSWNSQLAAENLVLATE